MNEHPHTILQHIFAVLKKLCELSFTVWSIGCKQFYAFEQRTPRVGGRREHLALDNEGHEGQLGGGEEGEEEQVRCESSKEQNIECMISLGRDEEGSVEEGFLWWDD